MLGYKPGLGRVARGPRPHGRTGWYFWAWPFSLWQPPGVLVVPRPGRVPSSPVAPAASGPCPKA